MEDDPFYSPKLLLDRARKNIERLNESGKSFAESTPYAVSCDFDPNLGKYVYKIGINKPTPPEFSMDTAEILSGLKSALDHSLCASVSVLSPAKQLSGISFPFADIEGHFDGAVRKGCGKLAPEITAFVRTLKPYKGGDDALWLMNRLSGINRHRIIQPVALSGENAFAINYLHIPTGGVDIPCPEWDATKNQLIFAYACRRDLQYDLNFAFHISFGKVDMVAGQPVVPVLRYFLGEVERIVMGIEAETNRLLASRS